MALTNEKKNRCDKVAGLAIRQRKNRRDGIQALVMLCAARQDARFCFGLSHKEFNRGQMATKQEWHNYFLAMPTYKLVSEWNKHSAAHAGAFGKETYFAAMTREQMIESLAVIMSNLSQELPVNPPHPSSKM
jgi:hypothetical protein